MRKIKTFLAALSAVLMLLVMLAAIASAHPKHHAAVEDDWIAKPTDTYRYCVAVPFTDPNVRSQAPSEKCYKVKAAFLVEINQGTRLSTQCVLVDGTGCDQTGNGAWTLAWATSTGGGCNVRARYAPQMPFSWNDKIEYTHVDDPKCDHQRNWININYDSNGEGPLDCATATGIDFYVCSGQAFNEYTQAISSEKWFAN